MRLRWTDSAAQDLDRIADYLFEQTPLHAERLTRAIYQAPEILLRSPRVGRAGRRDGTRELMLAPLPWILVHVVGEQSIDIVRVLHGAQRWP
ncbi:MAG: type II toxin-antitoxin system RelE/ParE family toxin [Acidobacteriaceae bacterium]